VTTAGRDPRRQSDSRQPTTPDGVPLGTLASLGAQFAAALVAFGFLGRWLDQRWHSEPWCLLLGVFLGGGGVFFTSYRRIMAQGANARPHDAPDSTESR
jgi:F0F1-type ATP synthase assembly protein I